MRRRDLLGLALAPLVSCGRARSRTIRVAAQPYPSMSPLFQSIEQGYYAAEGLNVEHQPILKSTDALPSLASGRLDVAMYGLSGALLNAVARGARIRIVAGRIIYTEHCPDSHSLIGSRAAFPQGFNSLRQLKGKRIAFHGVELGESFRLDLALQAGGLTRADVALVTIPENEGAALVAAGKIDVVIALRDMPQYTELRDHIVLGPSYGSFMPDHMDAFIMFGPKLLDNEPAHGLGFVRAYLKGARDFAAGKTPRFLDDFCGKVGLDAQLVRRACRSDIVLDGRISLASIQSTIDYAVRNKMVAEPLEAAQLVDTRFLDSLSNQA